MVLRFANAKGKVQRGSAKISEERERSWSLSINTKNRQIVEVTLKKEGKALDSMSSENEFGSQVLLDLIINILKENKLEFSDLSGVEVEKGPGSFTGLKVGASVANALGFSVGIPVNGKKAETELNYQ